MQVEVEVVGKPANRWTVNQPIIRIGRGARCDVSLPARQFPSVNILHAELEEIDGALRLTTRDSSPSQLLLNGELAQTGDVVLSGDILGLGPDGPELKIVYVAQASPDAGYVPTRVISVSEVPGREATRLMDVPGQTVVEARSHAAAPPPRPLRPPVPEAPRPIAQPVAPIGGSLGRFADKGDSWPAASKPAVTNTPVKPPVMAPPPPAPAMSAAFADPALLSKLRNLQIMQGVALAIIVLLGVWVFQLRGEVATNHDQLRALSAQDQNALGQLTPSLDARLNAFGQRMDGMDAMFKTSQERMEKGMDLKMKEAEDQLDVRMKATEDRMIGRMNTELPPMLDKYINAKMAEVKH